MTSSVTIVGIFLLLLLIILPVTAVDLAEQFFNEGVNFSELGQYSDAVASYDKAIFIKGSNALYWNNRGMALDNLGRYTDAITSYDKALAVKPDYVDAWNNRGVSLRKLGRIPDAIASYDKALAINPDYTEALENREITIRRKNQSDQTTMIAAIIFIALVATGAFVYIRYRKLSEQKVIVLPPHENGDIDGTKVPKSRLITLAGLCSVINKHGISILDDPEKVEAELNVLCAGEYQKERDVLILALKENIPQELLKSHHKVRLGNTARRLRKRLTENHGIPDERAQWALETWEKALGIQEQDRKKM